MTYNDGLSLELYIMELCEALKPKSCEDLEVFADQIHQHVEIAIEDFISDSENLNIDDYEPRY